MYTVYKNRPNKYASVHRAACRQLRKNGGVSIRVPSTGNYVEGFTTVEAARQEASSTGWEIRICSFCNP